MPQENQQGGLLRPQRAKTNLPPVAIGQDEFRETAAKWMIHVSSILSSTLSTVKLSAFLFVPRLTVDFNHYSAAALRW